MLPFKGRNDFKQKVVEQARWHEEADLIEHNIYSALSNSVPESEHKEPFAGCSLGCTVSSLNQVDHGRYIRKINDIEVYVGAGDSSVSMHEYVSRRLNIPKFFAFLQEWVFETAANPGDFDEKARGYSLSWTPRFLEAIPTNVPFTRELTEEFRKAVLLRSINKYVEEYPDTEVNCQQVNYWIDNREGFEYGEDFASFLFCDGECNEREFAQILGDTTIEIFKEIENGEFTV